MSPTPSPLCLLCRGWIIQKYSIIWSHKTYNWNMECERWTSTMHTQYTLSTYLKNACHKSQDKLNKKALEMVFIMGEASPCRVSAWHVVSAHLKRESEWEPAFLECSYHCGSLMRQGERALSLWQTPRATQLTMDGRREARRESTNLQPCDPRAV